MENFVKIELFGQAYTFKTDNPDNSESVVDKSKAVADFLVQKVGMVESQLSGNSPNLPKLTIMILAALNIANDNYDLKLKHSALLNDISRRSSNLIDELDSCSQQQLADYNYCPNKN